MKKPADWRALISLVIESIACAAWDRQHPKEVGDLDSHPVNRDIFR